MEQTDDSIFLVKDALEMVIIFDSLGKITYANDAAVRKLEYDDLCSGNISDVFPNNFKAVSGGIETDYQFGYELQNLVAYRENRTCFPAEVRIMPSSTQTDKYICMINDTLEKSYLNREIANVQQEAQQAMKVKSEFVANVTHELRTPVNSVLGNVRELLERVSDEKNAKQLRTIERCCSDMNKIIDNILDFSKLEAGKFTLEPRKFNIREMLDHIKASHNSKITEKGLEFFMTVSPHVPEYIVGDELRIKQVLNNLLSNALKFTSVGKVTLEVLKTAQVGDRIELFFIVIDSGIGIDKADKDKLFQSFSQVDASISRRYGGTGLGLNICKQLVELMGGSIGVESEKGKGSTFSFSVWAGVCDEEGETSQINDIKLLPGTAGFGEFFGGDDEIDNLKRYGSEENTEALNRNLSKLILCVEMENWEKAEMLMETIRQLTQDAPSDIGRIILKLKMAVQKENYDKVTVVFEELNNILQAKENVNG